MGSRKGLSKSSLSESGRGLCGQAVRGYGREE